MFYKINYNVDIEGVPGGYRNGEYSIYDKIISDIYIYVDFEFELEEAINDRIARLAYLGVTVNDYTYEEISNKEYFEIVLNKIKRRSVEALMTKENLPEEDIDKYCDDTVYLCRALGLYYEETNQFMPSFYSKNHEETQDDDELLKSFLNFDAFKIKEDNKL